MIGRTISHYRIEAELGRGGMGVVYRAFDKRLRRPVAVKVVPKKIAGHAERRARILAEARAAAPLNHPSIATIYAQRLLSTIHSGLLRVDQNWRS